MGQRDSGRPALAAAVGEARTAFAVALARRDAAAASTVYAEDATLVPPASAPMRGRSAIESFWRAGLEAGVVGIQLEALTLECGDPFAYELGRYELRLEPSDGETLRERGTYLLVHAMQSDGSWRRAAEMLSPDALPGPAHGLAGFGER